MKKPRAQTFKKLGGDRKFLSMIVMLVVSIVLMFATFGYVTIQNQYDQEYITLAGEERVLSQRIATYALEAANGNRDAFEQLRVYRDEFQYRVDVLNNGNTESGLPPTSESSAKAQLTEMGSTWSELKASVNTILNARDPILSVRENAQSINELIPQLLADSDEVVSILVERKAPQLQVYRASVQLMLAQRIANNVNKVLVGGQGSVTAADRFGRDITIFGNVLSGMLNGDESMGIRRVNDPEGRAKLEEVSKHFAGVSDKVGAILEKSPELFEVQDAVGKVTRTSDKLGLNTNALVSAYTEAGEHTAGNVLALIFGLLSLSLLILLGISLKRDADQRTAAAEEQNRRHQEAILRLLDEIQGLSEGDLTAEAVVTEDFTGAIADAFNSAIAELRKLVTTINETSVQVASGAQQTQATAMHLAEASDHQAQQITAASSAVNEMAISIEEVSDNAAESTQVAQHSVDVAHKGADTVRRSIQAMDTIREQIQETSKRIKRLGESSQEIGDIVELINDIADQTNILALNAAIQAAMAGEAGRGFAVVADEVQRLAERSGNATKQIEALVKTIQTDTNEAVISMEQSTAGVVKGAQLSEDAGEALEEIEGVSSRLAELVQAISQNATQQSNAAGNISDTMNVIQEITTQTSAGTNETAASIGNLAELANDLRKSVSDFKLPD
ncbi:MAG: chemotaxis protein [Gammaproteobacteria bacterium]|nr:chemotaxis protein [Gammaproteobacteria bacterium]NIR28324.1 chemotaxis protein [Gammaproteobacteria bacterium]NIR96738.1 chemotaxis protein [Gammaproteobacteria bacterium]NIT62440.1 chemotaxis protein [Gammaproteobacteria bacterium]NIV19373.1 chemotaxis protein [Gammaproteobacteria bacterium]